MVMHPRKSSLAVEPREEASFMANVRPIPEGQHTVTPGLIHKEAKKAIEFYKKAFGAEVKSNMAMPDGRVMHAELKIGDSIIFISDEFPEMAPDHKSPQTAGCVTGSLYLYVQDCDASFKRATDAGAKTVMPPADMFWGDRFAKVTDPFGHQWGMATHKEDLTPDQIETRRKEWEKQMAQHKK
jgi:PhnB protein